MNKFDAATILTTELSKRFPDKVEYKPSEVIQLAVEFGVSENLAYNYTKSFPKVARGVYNLESAIAPSLQLVPANKNEVPQTVASSVQSIINSEVYVPPSDKYYVSWGHSKDVEMVIRSRSFYPTFVTGLSGNGKTTMVEQACASTGRQYVRVQITPETDEDDLLGGFRLINGETVFAKGPVIKAMEAGALLLIDEIDRGSNKIMCLQGVLEGKPIMIKKTGEVIKPANGFNVIATANTKGQGSDDGRFIAATIIDEAFLERFTITLEQPYPSLAVEKKIVMKHMDKFVCKDEDFANRLTQWSDTIRKTYKDGGVDDIISTRRLCHIVQTYSIFKNRAKSIDLCISRFDEDTKAAFADLYKMIDDSIEAQIEAEQKLMAQVDSDYAVPSSIDDMMDNAISSSDPAGTISEMISNTVSDTNEAYPYV